MIVSDIVEDFPYIVCMIESTIGCHSLTIELRSIAANERAIASPLQSKLSINPYTQYQDVKSIKYDNELDKLLQNSTIDKLFDGYRGYCLRKGPGRPSGQTSKKNSPSTELYSQIKHFIGYMQEYIIKEAKNQTSTNEIYPKQLQLPTLVIIDHLDKISWNNVVSVNDDLSQVTLKTTKYGVEHTFDVHLTPQYPIVMPRVEYSLPVKLDSYIEWRKESSIQTILDSIHRILDEFNSFIQTLHEFDGECHIIEPINPSFSIATRRISVTRSCSLIIQIDKFKPNDICDIKVLGPPDESAALNLRVTKNSHLWSSNLSPLKNLEKILEISLKRSAITDSRENASVDNECAICYSYHLDHPQSKRSAGSTFSSVTPEDSCGNALCRRHYHRICLIDWLKSIPSSRYSFGMIFGLCPYCQQDLSVKL